MKARLRDHVMFGGSMTRDVELVSFDWARRVAFLADGRWVSIANVVIGEPFGSEPARPLSYAELVSPMKDPAFVVAKAEELDGFARQDNVCLSCGKQFDKPAQLNGHKRHCKGVP